MNVPPDLERQILARATHINGVPVPPPSVPQAATSPEPEGDPSTWTEKAFQARVVALARSLGWLCYHTLRSVGCEPGFPDLCLVKPGSRVAFLELKKTGGKLTAAQKKWLNALRGCPGVVAEAFWSEDWPKVEELLR